MCWRVPKAKIRSSLNRIVFTCTSTEANEVAIGMARAAKMVRDAGGALPGWQLSTAKIELASLGWLNDRPEIELYEFLPMLIGLACAGASGLLAEQRA